MPDYLIDLSCRDASRL